MRVKVADPSAMELAEPDEANNLRIRCHGEGVQVAEKAEDIAARPHVAAEKFSYYEWVCDDAVGMEEFFQPRDARAQVLNPQRRIDQDQALNRRRGISSS